MMRRSHRPAADRTTAALPPIPDLGRVFGSRVPLPEPTYLPDPPAPPRNLGARFVRAVSLLVIVVFGGADIALAVQAGGVMRAAGFATGTAILLGAALWRLVQLPKPFDAPTQVPRRRWLR